MIGWLALPAAAAVLILFAAYWGTGVEWIDGPSRSLVGMSGEAVAGVPAVRELPEAVGKSVSDAAQASASVQEAVRERASEAVRAAAGAAESLAGSDAGSGFVARLVERHVYEMTNAQRKAAGVDTLARIQEIDAIARDHSADMAARGYFAHVSPQGADPSLRAELAGYECRKDFGSYYTEGLAENIFHTHTYSSYSTSAFATAYDWLEGEEELARQMVGGWMDSPGHKRNILDPQFDRIGIGVHITADEQVLATQNFC